MPTKGAQGLQKQHGVDFSSLSRPAPQLPPTVGSGQHPGALLTLTVEQTVEPIKVQMGDQTINGMGFDGMICGSKAFRVPMRPLGTMLT